MRLKKVSGAYWAGNGFGTESARWVIADHPDIRIEQLGLFWWALRGEGEGFERLANGDTRKQCVDNLAHNLRREEV